MLGHPGSGADCFEQAAGIRFAGSRKIKIGPVLDRGPYNWQAQGYIHAQPDAQHFHSDMSLIVIHGHCRIKFALQGPEENRITGKGSGYTESKPDGLCNGGLNPFSFLGPKQAMLACMRI